MESKYLARFQKLESGQLPLRGNRMLVEVLPKPEIKSAGGLVLSSGNDTRTSTKENQADVAIVLAVGTGYVETVVDEATGEEKQVDVDIDIKPGSVILVSRMGLRLYSQFPGLADYTAETIALTRDTEVHCAWPSIEAFNAYQATLNS